MAFIGENVTVKWSAIRRIHARRRASRWATPAALCPARQAPHSAKKVALEAVGVKGGKIPSETTRRPPGAIA